LSRRTFGLIVLASAVLAPVRAAEPTREELLVAESLPAARGGRLVIALRSEPKTLNPVIATDSASRDVIGLLKGTLIRINRETQKTEPALARSWAVSADGRHYTLALRRGVRFSDGHPFDADDVVFSWQVYLDEKNHSPQRDLLLVGGKPIAVRKLDPYTVAFDLEEPYAAGERLFDGLAILPRHVLQKAVQDGKLAEAWSLVTAPAELVGLGPFRLKSYAPGERVVLERNPNYWKADRKGTRLPYVDELTFLLVPSEDAQVIRFQSGDTDLASRLSAENFQVLAAGEKAGRYRLQDLGPGLEYSFLFFNLGDLTGKGLDAGARRQTWFKDVAFRRAVSAALDREAMARLAFGGRAAPLGSHVTPGNKLWAKASLAAKPRSLDRARQLLKDAGYSWKSDGALADASGQAVDFTLMTNASNAARVKMASIAEDDLRELGIKVRVVTLETRAVLDQVLQTRDYDACILGFGSGDADPNVEMNIWLSSGPSHLWNPAQAAPSTPWEAAIDRLMRRQLITVRYEERRRLYDEVQQIVADNLPMIPLLAPSILVGAKQGLLNFRPAILDHYVLWNAEELGWSAKP